MAYPNKAGVGEQQIGATGDQNIDGILTGYGWNSLNLTYSFPNSSADYGTSQGTGSGQYNDPAPFNNLAQLNNQQQTDVLRAFALISSYTQLVFTPMNETATDHAVLRLADSSSPNTSYSFEPTPGGGANAGP